MSKISKADRLTSQLYHLPAIIGRLGVSIANAQRALNVDYLEHLTKLVKLFDQTVGSSDAKDMDPATVQALTELIKSFAPSRYQFTESTIDFSADLSQSMDVSASGTVGTGLGAVAISASGAVAYGYDYRAAARIKSTLHAIPADEKLTGTFLEQANKVSDSPQALPAFHQHDADLKNLTASLTNRLLGTSIATDTTPEKEE